MSHIIKNFDALAVTPLRQAALSVAEAGLAAIDTPTVITEQVSYVPATQQLIVQGTEFDLSKIDQVVCIGFGKAAFAAVSTLQQIMKERISCGFVLDLNEGIIEGITCRVGTHPLPTIVNVRATEELIAMVSNLTERDLVLCVVSGGGSSLLCSPVDMTCDEQARLTHLLMTKGAAIEEINTVRKHISNVKGGNLAKICYPAMVVSLIFSDVPNDDLGMVASGPTVLDTSTIHDAEKILQKYDALTLCKLPHCALYETPKNLDYFKNVHNILMVSPQRALESMASKAEELGFRSKIWNAAYTGDAALIAKDIVQAFEPGVCLLGAGESTVVVSGNGKGGRNQHLALVALEYVAQKQILVTVASDGVDNSDHAGAIADKITASHASSKMLNPNMYIKNNDSYTFFSETGDGLITGKTGANISDLFVSIEAL